MPITFKSGNFVWLIFCFSIGFIDKVKFLGEGVFIGEAGVLKGYPVARVTLIKSTNRYSNLRNGSQSLNKSQWV